MTLPAINPTGAMASGEYVDYMITYLNTALDSEEEQLDDYLSKEVYDGWDSQWTRQVTDLTADISELNTRVNKLLAQSNMARDAINKL
jgi:hypothetical protein